LGGIAFLFHLFFIKNTYNLKIMDNPKTDFFVGNIKRLRYKDDKKGEVIIGAFYQSDKILEHVYFVITPLNPLYPFISFLIDHNLTKYTEGVKVVIETTFKNADFGKSVLEIGKFELV
jgi:hypothetical protein